MNGFKKQLIEEYGKEVKVVNDPIYPEKKFVDAEFVNYLIQQMHEIRFELQKCKGLLEFDEAAQRCLKMAGKK